MNFQKFLNFKNILLGAGIFVMLIAIASFSGKLPIFNSSSQKLKGNVYIWGTIPRNNISQYISDFYKETEGLNLIYTEIRYEDFNSKLTSALADGVAPDLILVPIDILFANANRLYPLSFQSFSESSFRNTYVDSASILIDSLIEGYLGLPVSVDPLVLFYNRDILSTNGFSDPPKTWADFYHYEDKITKIKDGNITMSTIAFGTYDNIPHITDILLAMIFQQGEIPVSRQQNFDVNGDYYSSYIVNVDNISETTGLSPLNSALAFTKDFSDTQKSTYNWSARSTSAREQFIAGNLAFYIGFASEAYYIKLANQKLYFDYTYLPQVEGSQVSATYANLYAVSMLRTTPNINLAYPTMITLSTGPLADNLAYAIGGLSPLKTSIAYNISYGDQRSEIFGNSVLISKTFYDLHRSTLEDLMREAIRQIYNGEKSTVEASHIFTEALQDAYNTK